MVLTDDGLNQDVPDTTEDKLPSKTGEIFTKVNFANVAWNSNKAELKDCTNTGAIEAKNMNAAGIVGTSHCITEISNCENTGNINSRSKAGGILSELKTTDNLNVYSKFKGCTNSGEITSKGSSVGSSGGIISHVMGCIKINNCINNNNIKFNTLYLVFIFLYPIVKLISKSTDNKKNNSVDKTDSFKYTYTKIVYTVDNISANKLFNMYNRILIIFICITHFYYKF